MLADNGAIHGTKFPTTVPSMAQNLAGRCGLALEARRGGSGQATKRSEAALLAVTLRGATCLGARGYSPSA